MIGGYKISLPESKLSADLFLRFAVVPCQPVDPRTYKTGPSYSSSNAVSGDARLRAIPPIRRLYTRRLLG
jgi:hypothetical protein